MSSGSSTITPDESPISIKGHFIGNIEMVDDGSGKGTKTLDFKKVDFKLEETNPYFFQEIVEKLNKGESVSLGTSAPAPATVGSETTGGKSIKKRGRKNRKTKKHGNKKYRNKK